MQRLAQSGATNPHGVLIALSMGVLSCVCRVELAPTALTAVAQGGG